MLPPLVFPTSGYAARRPSAQSIGLAVVLTAGITLPWAALMLRFGTTDIYAALGPPAAAALVITALMRRDRLRQWLAPSRRGIVIGLVSGLLMTALTYPAFSLAAHLAPWLVTDVAKLYAGATGGSLAPAMLWVFVILTAEEVLWRGMLFDALSKVATRRVALALAVLSYGAAQLGTGSWLVVAIALGCGTVWTLQRIVSGSVLCPLISHGIWTPTVLLAHPVV